MSQDASFSDQFNAPRDAELVTVFLALAAVVAATVGLHPALDRLATDLDASAAQVRWVVNVFPVGLVLSLIGLDRFSGGVVPYRALLGGSAIFGLANLALAFSDELVDLLVLRSVAGLAAAFVVLGASGTLRNSQSQSPNPTRPSFEGEKILIGALCVGGVFGFFSAAAFVQQSDWSLFFVAVFVMIIVAMVADLIGALESAPDEARPEPRGNRTGATSDWALVMSSATLVITMALMSGTSLAAFAVFREVLGLSPLEAAVGALPVVVGAVVGALVTPLSIERFGLAQTLALAAAILAVAYGWLMLTDTAYGSIAPALTMLGIGSGLALRPAAQIGANWSTTLSYPSYPAIACWAGVAIGLTLLGSLPWEQSTTVSAVVALITGCAIYGYSLRTASTRSVHSPPGFNISTIEAP